MMKPPGSHGGNSTQRCEAGVQNQLCSGQLMAPAKEGEEGADQQAADGHQQQAFSGLKGLSQSKTRVSVQTE